MTNEYRHIPVLLHECLENLAIKRGGIYVDATLGGAGHSYEIAKRIGVDGLLIGIDQDDVALLAARQKLGTIPADSRPELALLKGNFSQLDDLLVSQAISGIDGILFDLGVSSVQIDTPGRGFSFKEDCPLDMRMNPRDTPMSAHDVVMTYSQRDLARIISEYSDEKWASRIAQFIVREREQHDIATSGQLVDIIKAAIPASARRVGGHPAKRTFQALRIEVNDELGVLKQGLTSALRWLNPDAHLCVISYHSLEDKLVKHLFYEWSHRCTCPVELGICTCGKKPLVDILTKKAYVAQTQEVRINARSRSAKLRVCKRCADSCA